MLDKGVGNARWVVESTAKNIGSKARRFHADSSQLRHPCGHLFQGDSPTCKREHK